MEGNQFHNKQHGDTMQKKARDMFLCSLQINIKKRARHGSVMRDTCVLIKLGLFLLQLKPYIFQFTHITGRRLFPIIFYL